MGRSATKRARPLAENQVCKTQFLDAFSTTKRVIPSSNVHITQQFGTVAFGMAAALAWGTSDFMGGYFTRRANAFLFTAIFNIGGLAMVGSLALASHAQIPTVRSAIWALVGGISGSAGVAIFFRALASGRMGLIAPVAAVLSAAIPAVFSAFTDGLPGRVPVLGFVLAAVGLWLITRAEDGNSPEGIGLAVIAGFGFAGFYLCTRQAGNGSVLWLATLTRTGGLLITGLVVLLQNNFREITAAGVRGGVIAGCIDSMGTMLFMLASQSGRLDAAVVISSLYPAVTVILARFVLKEHLTRWRFVGLLAALAAVPMIGIG